MGIRVVFSTLLYQAPLGGAGAARLNRELLRECYQVREADAQGRRWSRVSYPGGYTSYASVNRLHRMSSTFEQLERRIRRHVRRYARELDYDLRDRALEMTDCWVNIMPRHVAHGLHLHPMSSVSGTYYVSTPRGCAGIKFEDPRLPSLMAAPPRLAQAREQNRQWVTLKAEAGKVVLFESWLRHEVPPNPLNAERVSISFNYSWF